MSAITATPTLDATPDRSMVRPLALAQFIASYAATNMNVAISDISHDLHTTVFGLQTAITLFTLVMASLMIPGSKLTDIWGRKRCFNLGLWIYGVGAVLAALAPGLGVMIVGYSVLEGVGSALMIPPIYILVTVWFSDTKTRAKYFGIVSGAAGLGSAAGPLIGGMITSAISWRASFTLQVLVVGLVIVLARRITDPPREGKPPAFDTLGAVLSAAGLCFIVLGILLSRTYGWAASRKDFTINGHVILPEGGISPVWIPIAVGVVLLATFFWHIRRFERTGKTPLIRSRLFRSKTANLGLGTQTAQWLVMQGLFFITSVYLQEVRHYGAIETGLILTPATAGVLTASALAERFASRHPQRWLIIAGFLFTAFGSVLLIALVGTFTSVVSFVPGLLFVGLGVGTMLTSSVNVVQSAFPEADQGDISGLSRSVSNLGSSLGTALCGSILVSAAVPGRHPYALSAGLLLAVTIIGLVLAFLIPGRPQRRKGVHAGVPRQTTVSSSEVPS
jgi:MFS family permease